ncbi:MAG: hypothetical protein PVJ53_14450 [Desulfobacterales bacterium]|jgi:hypothetical protein
MMRNLGIYFLVVVLMVAFSGIASAQDKPADNMELVKEKVRADKKLFIAENMQLSEAEGKAFWPVYESFQADMEKIYDRMGKLITNYAKNYQTMTDATAKQLIDEWLVIQADELNLRKSYLPKFRKVLSEVKVARYYQIENKIDSIGNYAMAAKIPLFK